MSSTDKFDIIPIISKKNEESSVFTPECLLREARRQKAISQTKIPEICLLDPDGDIVGYLLKENKAISNSTWPCYHTILYDFIHEEVSFGIIGGAVGAPFAVLVAEELFASGCKLLISISSAGQLLPVHKPPYFVFIEQAIRDEGTSYHYASPSAYSKINTSLLNKLKEGFRDSDIPVEFGASWTTDAPFRETASRIDYYTSKGVLAVEMEAAALYAFAGAKQMNVICFAHITNQMGRNEGDFEKGAANGSIDALKIISIVAKRFLKKEEIKDGT